MAAKTGADEDLVRYRALATEISELGQRQNESVQSLNECGMVKQELDLLQEDAPVFKLVGPVMLRQDQADAKTHVQERLDFIKNELDNVSKQIEEKQTRQRELGDRIAEQQREMKEKAMAAAAKEAEEATGRMAGN